MIGVLFTPIPFFLFTGKVAMQRLTVFLATTLIKRPQTRPHFCSEGLLGVADNPAFGGAED